MDFITVTAIQPLKRNTFQVYTDADSAPVQMNYEVIYCKGICQGRKFTEAQWNEILESETLRNARNMAIQILTGKDCTSGALYKKLIDRGIDPDAAAKTVSRCIALGEINDEAYAKRAAAYCLRQKRYGVNRAYQWMLQKGIPKETAKKALEQLSGEVDSNELIRQLIAKRYAEKLREKDPRKKQNVIAALARRGYPIGQIRQAIEDYLTEVEQEENEGEELWQ
jgi:regulatory protein